MRTSFKQYLLNEIIRVGTLPHTDFGITKDQISNETFILKLSNELSLYKISLHGTNEIGYGLKLDDYIAMIIGVEVDIEGTKYLIEKRTVTLPEYKRQGYMSKLFNILLINMHMYIVSDKEHTSDNEILWGSLIKKYKSRLYDTHTNTFINADKREQEIYVNHSSDHRYLYVIYM